MSFSCGRNRSLLVVCAFPAIDSETFTLRLTQAHRMFRASKAATKLQLQITLKHLIIETMGRRDKLKARLLDGKQVLTWNELVTLLTSLGYKELKRGGSRVKFDNGNPDDTIILHRPHPGNQVKHYAVKLVLEKLIRAKML